mgnify:FL=1|jgi:hypothetical protein
MGPLDVDPERSDQRSWSLSGGREYGWARPEGAMQLVIAHVISERYTYKVIDVLYVVGMQ